MSGDTTTGLKVFAPGRVNLIGDHTDYMGGLVLPMAIHLGITLDVTVEGDRIVLDSDRFDEPADLPLPVDDPAAVDPPWSRYVAGVAAEMATSTGLRGRVGSDLPIAGLSSSAALEVAVALALGFDGPVLDLAQLCQRAEQRASGVPCGIMDQLTSAAGIDGRALLIDCHDLTITPVALPDDAEVVVVHSGQHRELVDSEYATRRAQCEAAEAVIGPLRLASLGDEAAIEDPVLAARARHVIGENQRVRDFAAAVTDGDLAAAGAAMVASHRSLADDFEVSTPILDALVDELCAEGGVHGARLTGAGFGGAVVALTEPGALDRGWVVRPSAGARILGGAR